MKSLRVGVGVVCARILAVYILMLIGGIVGWGIFTCLSQPLAAGRMDSAPVLGLMLLLVLSVVQYVLLVVAVRRILCKKRQLWGICLFAYSVAFAYVFPIVTYIT